MPDTLNNGVFVISLDFELFWGVRDKRSKDDYAANILGARAAVPRLLELFSRYGIHATWATVGFLFFDTLSELTRSIPEKLPQYTNPRLNPYTELDVMGSDEASDPYHYGRSLVEEVQNHPDQEIATHTFSHYYCLEDGQSMDSFEADLAAAIRTGKRHGIEIRSLVLPRNQYTPEHLRTAKRLGITSFRGNPPSWIYQSRRDEDYSLGFKVLRFADSFVDVTGHNCSPMPEDPGEYPVNLPASQFLYPYSPRSSALDALKLRRIRSGMRHAAENGLIYHLWWHPHNFGVHTDENLRFLTRILEYFTELQGLHAMESSTMQQLASRIETAGRP